MSKKVRVKYYVSLSTEAVIAARGDDVYSPEIEGTVPEKTDSQTIQVYQGRLVKKSRKALRKAVSAGAVKLLPEQNIPKPLEKTLQHEIGRLDEGKEARVLNFSRFILPWDCCGFVERAAEEKSAPKKEPKSPPKKSEKKAVPKVDNEIFKQGLRLLARRAKERK